jgi:Domain of unknown function (DUF5666)
MDDVRKFDGNRRVEVSRWRLGAGPRAGKLIILALVGSAAYLFLFLCLLCLGMAAAQTQTAAAPTEKAVGTAKTISGNVITLTTDAGSSTTIQVNDSTRMVRIAPGQKDLKDAVPLQLPDLQVADRMLVRGKLADDGKSIVASSVIVIKEADLAAKQDQERQDWQRRGVGGLVTAVDASGTITISMGLGKTLAVHTTKDTAVRRYSPDSVRFDDAKPATVGEVKTGDQLRARGTKNADGTEMTAEGIVFGSFRNIAGTVISTDAANNSLSVLDLLTKKPVTLKITGDSQLHSLPPAVAQRIAMRLKGGTPGAGQGANPNPPAEAAKQPGEQRPGGQGGGRPGGSTDFQQILSRMPALALGDLQKGNAVIIVATEGTANSQPSAITLLSGVEPILTASPDSNRAAMLLSPWNLEGGGGGDSGAGTNP